MSEHALRVAVVGCGNISGAYGETIEYFVAQYRRMLVKNLDRTSSDLSSLFDGRANAIGGQLDKTSAELSGLFNSKTKGLSDQLGATTAELTALFSANTKMMSEQLDTTATASTTISDDVDVTSVALSATPAVAEGGAITGDSDETDRILDVEIRVGSPELDNTRGISEDPNQLNDPLRRRAVVPFGEDPLG